MVTGARRSMLVFVTEKPARQARVTAIGRLPTPYAVALRLRESGEPDEVIAEALGIDLMALPALMELAEAKLAAIQRRLDTKNHPE